MKWTALIVLFLAFTAFRLGNSPKEDEGGGIQEIAWSADRPLTWKDFKANPPRGGVMDALTQSGIEYSWGCNGGNFVMEVDARFDPATSWVKRGASKALLKHEQLHFDITEIHARKMRKHFSELRGICWKGKEFIRKEAKKILNSWHEMQDSYDKETEHSKITSKQEAWAQKVARQLEDLEPYSKENWK